MSTARAARRPGPVDVARIAGRGIAARRLRSGLTAVGIAIGIAAMVAVLAISDASRASLLSTLDRLGTNLLTVSPGQSFLGKEVRLPEGAAAMIRRIGPVESASATSSTKATVRRTDLVPVGETGGISVVAADTSLLQTLGGELAAGRYLDAALEQYPTVVLGAKAAARLGIVDLDRPTRVWLGGRWFEVVGILRPLPLAEDLDAAALVGRPAARAWLGADTSPTALYVRADPAYVDDVRRVLGATANPERPEAVVVARPSDAIEARAAAATAFTALLLGLGAVALGVGALGIANVMLMSVMERRSEIGLRRALGATQGAVAGQFLGEALLLAGLGGAAGVATGLLIAGAYAGSQGWPIVVSPLALSVALAATLLVGGLAGLYPAVRASRISPTEALRTG